MLGKSEDFGTAVSERRASMRLCDLDEIKVCVDRQYENCHGYSGSKKAIYREAILAVKSILHAAKPIDAVSPVRHAKWVDNHCTACGMTPMGDEMWKRYDCDPHLFDRFMDYCPTCGAKMDGGAD